MRNAGPNRKEIEPEAAEEAERILAAAGIQPESPEKSKHPTREPDAPGPGAAAEAERILAAAEKADVLGPIAATGA